MSTARRTLLVLLLASASLSITDPSSADRGKHYAHHCPPRPVHTHRREVDLATGRRTAVYSVFNFDSDGAAVEISYACYVPTQRPTYLLDDPAVIPPSVRISGEYAAFIWGSPEGADDYSDGIDLVNARTGRVSTVTIYDTGTENRFKGLVLKHTGALAWSERRRIYVCRAACVGARRDVVRAGTRLVAHGPAVDARSLMPIRGGIRWRERGRWRTARLT